MPGTEYEIVRQAILDKNVIIADYDNFERQMCPHVIGWKRGQEQALFYQFGGSSPSGLGVPRSPDNWRCIKIHRLSNVRSQPGGWYSGPHHSRPQTCVDHIDVEVT
jgi:hypothetical protein